MAKTKDIPFKSTYGPLSRREVMEKLRRPYSRNIWELCLLVCGFNPDSHQYPQSLAKSSDGGLPSRIYSSASTAGLVDLNGKGTQTSVDRALFMAKVIKPRYDSRTLESMSTDDTLARTLRDYLAYKALPQGHPSRDDFINALPGPITKGPARYKEIFEYVNAQKGLSVSAVIEDMVKKKHPLAFGPKNNLCTAKTLRDYYDKHGNTLKTASSGK